MLDLALRAVATAFLLASALRLWAKHRARPAGIPGALLCIGLVAYLAAPHLVAQDPARPSSFLILAGAIANPGLIWLVARGLFRERAAVGSAQKLIVSGSVVLGLVCSYELPRTLFGSLPLVDFAARVTPHGVALAFVLLALIEAQRDVRSDLVEPRRRLRVVFVTSMASYAALVALVETALRGERPPASLELMHLGLVAVAALAAAVLIYRQGDGLLGLSSADAPQPLVEPLRPRPTGPPRPAPAHHAPAEPADPLSVELEAWIARKGFLEPELSISGLAKTLHTQEYKLRRLLNGDLGYRNFNDFVHQHRIALACELLSEPGARSILELSMEVGYRSLATFNRAFKDVTGVSPTEYRARCAESKPSK